MTAPGRGGILPLPCGDSTEQEVKPQRKLKKKAKVATTQLDDETVRNLDLDSSFNVADAKDDLDLDLDAARFQGKKGQAGTRTKGVSE